MKISCLNFQIINFLEFINVFTNIVFTTRIQTITGSPEPGSALSYHLPSQYYFCRLPQHDSSAPHSHRNLTTVALLYIQLLTSHLWESDHFISRPIHLTIKIPLVPQFQCMYDSSISL